MDEKELLMEAIKATYGEFTFFAVMAISGMVWLLRESISRWLDKSVETFKVQLQAEVDTYRSDLEKERIKLQISYGGIYEKQAEAILAFYLKLRKLEKAGEKVVQEGGGSRDNLNYNEFTDEWHSTLDLFDEQRILMPGILDRQIMGFLDDFGRNVFGYSATEIKLAVASGQDDYKNILEKQEQILESMVNEIPKLKKSINETMRQILGSEHATLDDEERAR